MGVHFIARSACLNHKRALSVVLAAIVILLSSFRIQADFNAEDVPFSKLEVHNTLSSYRCVGFGNSNIQSVARSKAFLNAKGRLVSAILNAYKKTVPNGQLNTVVLDNTITVKEDSYTLDDNSTDYWVLIEVSRSDIMSGLEKSAKPALGAALKKKFEKEMRNQKNTTY